MDKTAAALLSLSLLLLAPIPSAHADEPTTSAPAESLAKGDREFLEKALRAGLAEERQAAVALDKAQRKDVRDYAYMLSKDHGSDNAALRALAQKKNATAITDAGKADADALKRLREEPLNTFDTAYIKACIKTHEDALALYKSAARDVSDADIQAFAARTVPVLEKHLENAKAILKQ